MELLRQRKGSRYPGSFGAEAGRATCELCSAGKYTSDAGNTACRDCERGYLCVEGSSAPQPCPGGTHANQTVLNISGFLSSLGQCIACPEGTFCSVGSAEPTPCAPGTFNSLTNALSCEFCESGAFQGASGATACIDCTLGHFCGRGATAPQPCESGTYGNRARAMAAV